MEVISRHTHIWLTYNDCNMKTVTNSLEKKTTKDLYEDYYLMHVWINKDFKRSNCQGNVRSCSWNSQHVMKGLLSHIMGVYSFHQISIWHSHHCSIYSILKFPSTQLGIGINTRKPKPREVMIGEKLVVIQINSNLFFTDYFSSQVPNYLLKYFADWPYSYYTLIL